MKHYLFIIFFTILFSFQGKSQNSINDYKYIIIPTDYRFLKETDQYQLNSLTKFLFNKYGYTAFLQNEDYPDDLKANRCLALYADAIEDKSLFKTKIQIDLNDCDGKLVMSSRMGETREKEYNKAYNLALRDAFVTYQELDYKYHPNDAILSKELPSTEVVKEVEASKAEIERLQKEIETLKETTQSEPAKVVVPAVAVINNDSKNNQSSLANQKNEEELMITEETLIEVLYAQPIENGFQIVDTTPKKVMILYYSGRPDTFIVKGKDAIVYKKDDLWILAENNGANLTTEVINIKF